MAWYQSFLALYLCAFVAAFLVLEIFRKGFLENVLFFSFGILLHVVVVVFVVFWKVYSLNDKVNDDQEKGKDLEEFLKAIPDWIGKDSYVVHLDRSIYPTNPLVGRVEKTYSCYVHAALAVQNYVVKRQVPEAKMIKIRSAVLQTHSLFGLFEFGMDIGGVSAEVFLKAVLEPNLMLIHGKPGQVTRNDFQTHGPGLVSRFQVDVEFFTNMKKRSYRNHSKSVIICGSHAMALIGIRNDGKYYLLQNWWSKKQFVEVTPKYFEAHGARITFVGVWCFAYFPLSFQTKQMETRNCFPQVTSDSVEGIMASS